MGIIRKQGIQSAIISYSGIAIGFLSLLVIQPALLQPEEIGLTRILYSFSFLVSTILPLGIGNITTRFFPRFRNEQKHHHGFYGIILIWTGIGCLLLLPILWFLRTTFIDIYSVKSELFSDYFLLVFPFSVTIALISVTSNYLNSCFRPIVPAITQEIVIRLLFIILIGIYALGWINLNIFVIGYLATYLVQLIILLIYGGKLGELKIIPEFKEFPNTVIREMIHYGWMVFFAATASMIIKIIDVVILGKYVSLALTGIYAIAAFVPTFIEAPLNALDKVANARIAYSWEQNDRQNIKEIYYKSARYLFLLGGLLFLLVTLNSPHLFRWLPPEYKAGIPVIEILSLSALFNLITGSNTAIIFTSNKFYAGAIALIVIAILNFVLLLLLIPVLGLEGAAWATCISSFLYNLFKYLYILFKFRMQPFDKRTFYIGGSILLTYGFTNLLPVIGNVWADLIVTTLTIAGSYFVLTWLTRSADDLKDIIPFFRR